MLRLLGRKILHLIPVLFLVTLATTAMPDLMKLGDPNATPVASIAPQDATPQEMKALEKEYGYDKPLLTRYATWLGDALSGDLGQSIKNKQDVVEGISQRFPVTLQLAVMAMLIALLVAIPLGMWTASRAGGIADRTIGGLTSGLLAVPTFVSSILLVYFFATKGNLNVLPNNGWRPDTWDFGLFDVKFGLLKYAWLPAIALALAEIPQFQRLLRSDMLATLQEDYILTARSKGLSTPYILFRHALRPSSFSLVTVSGLTLGRLIGGTVIVEFYFSCPGLGQNIVFAIQSQDMPVVQGTVVVIACIYVLMNTLVDLGYALLDPRVRAR